MSLSINSNSFADLAIQDLRGERTLGGHRLSVNLRIQFSIRPRPSAVQLLELEGLLRVSAQDHEPVLLGRILADRGNLPAQTYEYPSPRNVLLSIDLDRAQIEAIEEMRNGRDLTFGLSLAGLAVEGSQFHHVGDQINHTVVQGVWVPLLERMGYDKRLLLEVPVPDSVSSPELAQAVEHLKNAQKQLVLGYAREAVGCCRDTLESLAPRLGDTAQQLPPDRQRTKKERLIQHRRSLLQLAHPARHADPGAAQFEWGRADAVAMISQTAALVSWVERLAREGQL